MGLLVNGQWVDQWYDTSSTGGKFVRQASQFRNFITRDGSSGFKGVEGRYHLYVSYACPWAHRTLIMRNLKGLQHAISVSVVNPLMYENGWTFGNFEGSTEDHLNNSSYLYEVYLRAKSDYTGRVTVPVLWDKLSQTAVSNESAEIILMFNSEFDCANDNDYYPIDKKQEIDETNTFVYDKINNGVYKAGFATTQEAYEEAVKELFCALDHIDQKLENQRYLVGNTLTVADIRLFTTLVRFDPVYVGHFKCNLQRIEEYKNLSNYLRDIYQIPGVSETVNFDHIKNHYYKSHKTINPTGVVPFGPRVDYMRPHDRDRFNRVEKEEDEDMSGLFG
ncbi:unnamed protein product [Blepharisma stoltei]|uniref:GST C-terminal domain-containing protein n=1 Tax=Blepharisma stoltei TaxID=1481888 RepID=A0AAU9J475_9CILI|nr:unnamed protein product [Blepharisma stoltei]